MYTVAVSIFLVSLLVAAQSLPNAVEVEENAQCDISLMFNCVDTPIYIHTDRVCDDNYDCSNGSDENGCSSK